MLYRTLMFLSWLACRTPRPILLGAGWVLGNLYYFFIAKMRRRAVEHMMPALGIDETEAKKLVRASFINMVRNVLDILAMPMLNEKNLSDYIEIDHLERMQEALAEGRGVVVLSCQIGCWERPSAAFTLHGMLFSAIAKPQPNIRYTRALDDLLATIHVEILARGASELIAAARALKRGKLLGFLADQDGGPGGAFIEFLGRTASTPLGPAVFSRKFRSPVVPAFILRQPNGKHKVIVGEIMRCPNTGDSDRDLHEFTVQMTAIVERIIRENPTQWIWFQKRWNTSPEEQKTGKHHVSAGQEEKVG